MSIDDARRELALFGIKLPDKLSEELPYWQKDFNASVEVDTYGALVPVEVIEDE